jgi:pyruvate dehydrogenase E2 component (dihydrolipoamide acetyltransferase)
MAEPVLMPQVGQDIETAVLLEWTVAVGDPVKANDVIALVESDKATFEVEAMAEGVVLKQLLEQGEEGKVLEPIAYVGQPGEEIEPETASDGPEPAAQISEVSAAQAPASAPPVDGHIAAAPAARRLAKERGVDLSTVSGTGPGGRIVRSDVLAAVSAAPARSAGASGDTKELIFSRLRRKVAERLTHSKQSIPHFYLYVDVDMGAALEWRRTYNERAATKATITDLIVRATAKALAQYPRLNGHVTEEKLIVHENINIGVAVSVDDGLVVPVVAGADQLSLEQISRKVRQNAEGARKGVLKAQAVGTFTISNLGMCAVGMFLPIINPPECAILGVGAISKRPCATADGSLSVANVMTLALACDHRAVDGTYAAAFLNELKKNLEDLSGGIVSEK